MVGGMILRIVCVIWSRRSREPSHSASCAGCELLMSGRGVNAKAPQERMQADEHGHGDNRKRQPDGCAEKPGERGGIIRNHDTCGEGEGFVFYEPEPFCEIRVVTVLQADESHVAQSHGERARNQQYGQYRPSDPAWVAAVCHAASLSRSWNGQQWTTSP